MVSGSSAPSNQPIVVVVGGGKSQTEKIPFLRVLSVMDSAVTKWRCTCRSSESDVLNVRPHPDIGHGNWRTPRAIIHSTTPERTSITRVSIIDANARQQFTIIEDLRATQEKKGGNQMKYAGRVVAYQTNTW